VARTVAREPVENLLKATCIVGKIGLSRTNAAKFV